MSLAIKTLIKVNNVILYHSVWRAHLVEVTSWSLVILVLKEAPGRKHSNFLPNTCVKQLPVPGLIWKPASVFLGRPMFITFNYVFRTMCFTYPSSSQREQVMDDSRYI